MRGSEFLETWNKTTSNQKISIKLNRKLFKLATKFALSVDGYLPHHVNEQRCIPHSMKKGKALYMENYPKIRTTYEIRDKTKPVGSPNFMLYDRESFPLKRFPKTRYEVCYIIFA